VATLDNNWIYSEQRISRWAWLIPLLGAILLHVLVILLIPAQFMVGLDTDADPKSEEVELTLLPPEPLTPEEMKYVEANPDVAENKPDPTNQYSFRDQQAANPEESDIPLEAPNVNGEIEDSTKIVQGAVDPAPPMPDGVYTPQTKPGEGDGTDGGKAGAESTAQVQPPKPKPAPAFLQQAPESTDGTGSTLDMIGEGDQAVENPSQEAPIDIYRPTESTNPAQVAEQGDGNGGNPDTKPMPRPRPKLSPELIHGPLAKSQGAATRRGAIALDATFSEFGEYEQQFYAALQAGWYQEIEFFQPIDTATRVVVRFKIRADGTILGTEVVFSNASEIATLICESAITKRSPFRPWTKEMVKVFGEERVLTVSFHYR
jgi:hypothetical protein